MNELLSVIIPAAMTAIGGIMGWLVGKRKQDNDFLSDQEASINLLIENNKSIVKKYTESQERILELLGENTKLKETIKRLEAELNALRRRNEANTRKLKEMQEKLDTLFNVRE